MTAVGSSKAISNREIFYLVFLLQQSGMFWLLPYFLVRGNGTLGISAIFGGLLTAIGIILVGHYRVSHIAEMEFMSALRQRHTVLGTGAGVLVCLLYLMFAILMLYSLVDVIQKQLLTETPRMVLCAVTVLLAGWLSKGGLESIARLNMLCIGALFIMMITSVVGTLDLFTIEHALPLQMKNTVQFEEALLQSMFCYSGLLVVFMLYPASREKHSLYLTLGKAVAAAETTVAGAVAGDCDGQYPAEAIDAYAKVIAEAKQKYEDVAQSQESVDAALLQLNEATKAFAAAKVIIDFAELKAIVATAKSAMTTAEPEKGEGAGKYPVAAFDALQAAIDKAAAIVGSKTVNQVTVDAECEALDKAIATFAAARVPNDYSQLRTLIAEAKALLEAVKNGQYECEEEDYEDMRASLEKNEALLYSTNQDDIDRAVKLLKRDIALFKSLITPTAIDSVEQSSWVITVDHGVLSVANLPQQASVYVYTLSGELVGEQSSVALTRGVYLVRIVAGDVAYTRKLMVE